MTHLFFEGTFFCSAIMENLVFIKKLKHLFMLLDFWDNFLITISVEISNRLVSECFEFRTDTNEVDKSCFQEIQSAKSEGLPVQIVFKIISSHYDLAR